MSNTAFSLAGAALLSCAMISACSDGTAADHLAAPLTSGFAKAPASAASGGPGGGGGGGGTGGGGTGGGGGGVKAPPVAQVCPGLPGDTTVTFDQNVTYSVNFPGGLTPLGALGHAGGIEYTLVFNFIADPTRPATQSVNLLCKTVSAGLIQSTFRTQVTGTIDVETSPFFPADGLVNVIHVHVIQIPTFLDKTAP